MPLRIFRSRNVSGSNVVIAFEVVGMFGMFFLGALYLQRVLGYNALHVGLAFLPTTVVMGTMSLRVAGPLTIRYGAKRMLILSLVAIVAGLVLFTQTPVAATYLTDILPPMLLVGFGAGLGFPAIMTLAMSSATPGDAGLASGLLNTSVQVGGAIGLAVLATLASSHTKGQLAHGASTAAALNSGYHLAYLVGAVVITSGIVIAAVVLRAPAFAMAPHGAPVDQTAGVEHPSTASTAETADDPVGAEA
jgi:MFS family permease